MEMEMAGVDPEPLGKLPVRQLPVALLPEHFQHAHPERVAESLQLLRLVEYQRVLHPPLLVCPEGSSTYRDGPVKQGAWLQQRDRGLQWCARRPLERGSRVSSDSVPRQTHAWRPLLSTLPKGRR